jgi:hypothetical protein
MARQGSRWAANVANPHSHRLPRGYSFTDPYNDRKCLKTGQHHGTEKVQCDVDDCQHTFGIQCDKCNRVV